MKPPPLSSIPLAENAGDDEICLSQIEQHVRSTNKPWMLTLQNDLTTLKIALVDSDEFQAHMQAVVFYPVFTVKEFSQLLAWAKRHREIGDLWDLGTIKRYGKMRADIGKILGASTFIEMLPERPEHGEKQLFTSCDLRLPKGWSTGGISACIVCDRGVAAYDPTGRPLHALCERKVKPCRSYSTS